MNDETGDCPFKKAVSGAIDALDPARAVRICRAWARDLCIELEPNTGPERLQDYSFRLPAYVMADLAGIPAEHLPETALWINDFVQCLSPIAEAEQLEKGKAAAGQLFNMVRSLLSRGPASSDGLITTLAHEAERIGRRDMDEIAANGIGFLTQSYEASWGLSGIRLSRSRCGTEFLSKSHSIAVFLPG